MAIYEKPTKALMAEWAAVHLDTGKWFQKAAVIAWFKQHYPKIKSNTVAMHVDGMSVNNRNRRHHANIRPGSGHDLFLKLDRDNYRLWDKENDPPARYKPDIEAEEDGIVTESVENELQERSESDKTFAYEKDLQSYLSRNLTALEPGLTLFQDEGLDGIEFDAGGRYIDILAIDKSGAFVVIELKVGRGYDRVIGQLLRYRSWIKQNMETDKPVRGVIIASDISDDLKLATADIPDIELVEYEISFALSRVALTV